MFVEVGPNSRAGRSQDGSIFSRSRTPQPPYNLASSQCRPITSFTESSGKLLSSDKDIRIKKAFEDVDRENCHSAAFEQIIVGGHEAKANTRTYQASTTVEEARQSTDFPTSAPGLPLNIAPLRLPHYKAFPPGYVISLYHCEVCLDPKIGHLFRNRTEDMPSGSFAKNADGVPTCTKPRRGLIVFSFDSTIWYIPFRTRANTGLVKVPERERARFLLLEMATRMGTQENHSPHDPVEVLEGSRIDLKDLSYIDALDMYPYVPIEGTEILGAVPTEDLQRVLALQKALQTHELPSVQGLNLEALQQYFKMNIEREDPPIIARSDRFNLPRAYQDLRNELSNSPRDHKNTKRRVK
ncbi:hypothetical protein SLS60_002359 [Paraconiothyrium brasiliense]|uniref:Uncharacterized protein n=1 Tax=Paraconiothyrium brasiliense TaxID=300254 RepID=A0ABR3S1W7_9PLEO